jgi:aminoglycoside 3-N-acetyltransferase
LARPALPVRGLASSEDNDGVPDTSCRRSAAGGIDDTSRRCANHPAPVDVTSAGRRWLKAKWLRARKAFVGVFLSYDRGQLLAALRKAGVREGDSVMLHSAFHGVHGFRGSIDDLIGVFIDAVGPHGHLLMVSLPYRSSSIDYVRKLNVFDVRSTPSMMGVVSEVFRRRPDVKRSMHPTHPVLVRGPRAEWFSDYSPTARYPCGPGSPFEKLATVDGKVVFFNVGFETYTFFHYLEYLVSDRLPFALYSDETFEVSTLDALGEPGKATTFVFAPQAIARRRIDILEAALRKQGHIQVRQVGASTVLVVRVQDSIDCVMKMASRGDFFYDAKDMAR